MRKIFSSLSAVIATVALSIGFMAVAQAQPVNQILANPKVDDIYAGRVDHFSEAAFGEGGKAYGLMRVVNVSSSAVIVVTEDAAWPEAKGALEDLKGDFSDITWDFDEEIEITRADLVAAYSSKMILSARRLTAEQIKEYLD